jgi:phosphate:Na+ symporter
MQVVKCGLSQGTNKHIKLLLKYIAGNKLSSILLGIVSTFLMQSSSATIVLIISFVNSDIIDLTQALGMLIGANIGTTITGQIISCNLERYFWVFFVIALLFYILYQKEKSMKYLAMTKSFTGFALIFLGLNILSYTLIPLGKKELFLKLTYLLAQNNILAFLSGILGTAILQSSSAFIGVILILARRELLNLFTALLLLMGSNIGTCITALIAVINASPTAKKVARGHVIFNSIGAIIFLPFLTPFSILLSLTSNELTREIANGHTIFNIINAVIFYLFFNKFVELLRNK